MFAAVAAAASLITQCLIIVLNGSGLQPALYTTAITLLATLKAFHLQQRVHNGFCLPAC